MTTHQTPPPGVVTRETWRTMVEANNDSAATDPVDWVETLSPHYNPRGRRRWLWHYAIPIGKIAPGEQAITSRSGTASSEAAAKRKIARLVSRHFDEEAGREPYAVLFDRIRIAALVVLLVAGLALIVDSLGCSPTVLGVVAIAAAAVGIAASFVRARRAFTRLTPVARLIDGAS
jgi:hypothetical protein